MLEEILNLLKKEKEKKKNIIIGCPHCVTPCPM